MLFFAGHRVRSDDGAYYLATVDTEVANIAGMALPRNSVAARLADRKARIAVFLAECHSGAAGTGLFSTDDDATQTLLERIPSGLVVVSASEGRELSEAAAAAGGGVFTSALVEVIGRGSGSVDKNHNGAIEISELYRAVNAEVVTTASGARPPGSLATR
jgi:uncharacterized caspase-like protein